MAERPWPEILAEAVAQGEPHRRRSAATATWLIGAVPLAFVLGALLTGVFIHPRIDRACIRLLTKQPSWIADLPPEVRSSVRNIPASGDTYLHYDGQALPGSRSPVEDSRFWANGYSDGERGEACIYRRPDGSRYSRPLETPMIGTLASAIMGGLIIAIAVAAAGVAVIRVIRPAPKRRTYSDPWWWPAGDDGPSPF